MDSDVSDDTKVAQFFEVFLKFYIPLFFSMLQTCSRHAIIAAGSLESELISGDPPMATREEMLDRVRKALGRPNTGSPVTPLPPLDLTGVMPPLAPEDYLAKFEAEWEKVAGSCLSCGEHG